MTDPSRTQADESLPLALARLARSRSDGALVAMATGGLLLAVACAIAAFSHWAVIAGAGVAAGALGLWGVCDRELAEQRALAPDARGGALLAGARVVVAIAGAGGALVAAFGVLRIALGTWIS